MKVLVAYMSKTGNTRKVAEAIYEEIQDEKVIKPIDDVESIEGYDVAFLGFPVHILGPDKKTEKILEKLCVQGRKVVLFVTHASDQNNPDLPPMLDKFRMAACGATIVDMFDCQGALAKSVKMIMSVYPNAKFRAWAKHDNSQGQPDQAQLERARAFSRNVMQKIHDVAPKAERVMVSAAPACAVAA